MARRKARRDRSTITSNPIRSLYDPGEAYLDDLLHRSPSLRRTYDAHLSELQDARLYDPDVFIREAAIDGRRARVTTDAPKKAKRQGMSLRQWYKTIWSIPSIPIRAFKLPERAVRCVRRKIRKQVLHAFGKTGKGARFSKRPRFREHSKVRC